MNTRKIPNINFMGVFPIAVFISTLLIVGSIYLFISQGETKYGIDFTGGHEVLVSVDEQTNSDQIRSAVVAAGFENAVVQAFEGGGSEFLIRVEGEQSDTEALKQKLVSAIKAKFSKEVTVKRQDFIGPTVGQELRKSALIAIIVSLLGLLAYITFRFEMAFAMGAIVALFHDVIVATGLYLLMGQTFSMGAVAAALTIVGYSINDTIVIFDKIREEIFHSKNYDLKQIMNRSINAMLSRTIITHVLTFFSAAALYFYGGGAISDLSLYLLAGIICGSYSTMYIACPVVLLWHRFRGGQVTEMVTAK